MPKPLREKRLCAIQAKPAARLSCRLQLRIGDFMAQSPALAAAVALLFLSPVTSLAQSAPLVVRAGDTLERADLLDLSRHRYPR